MGRRHEASSEESEEEETETEEEIKEGSHLPTEESDSDSND